MWKSRNNKQCSCQWFCQSRSKKQPLPELSMSSLPCNSKNVRAHQGDPRVVVAIYYSIVPVRNVAEIAKSFFSRPTTGPSALGLWVN